MHGFEPIGVYFALLKLPGRTAVTLSELVAQAQAIYGQLQAWSDQVDWPNLKPLVLVGGGILALFALLLYTPPDSDEDARKFRTDLALAGRWMVCGLTVGVVVLWKIGVV